MINTGGPAPQCHPTVTYLFRFTSFPCSWASINCFMMSAIVIIISSAWLRSPETGTKQTPCIPTALSPVTIRVPHFSYSPPFQGTVPSKGHFATAHHSWLAASDTHCLLSSFFLAFRTISMVFHQSDAHNSHKQSVEAQRHQQVNLMMPAHVARTKTHPLGDSEAARHNPKG